MGLLSMRNRTDAEVVERARRWLRWRRRVGVLLLIFGLPMTVGGGYAAYEVVTSYLEPDAWAAAGGEGEAGAASRTNPITPAQVRTEAKASLALGTTLGVVMVLGVGAIGIGEAYVCTRDRDREMLVALWDAAAAGARGPPAPPASASTVKDRRPPWPPPPASSAPLTRTAMDARRALMRLFSLLKRTDAKVVHIARQWLRWRRWLGVASLMVGLGVAGLAGYVINDVIDTIETTEVQVGEAVAGGEAESDDSERADAVVHLLMATQWCFMAGTRLGWWVPVGVAFFVVAFRWLLTRDREREMLVALWDAAAADEGETRE